MVSHLLCFSGKGERRLRKISEGVAILEAGGVENPTVKQAVDAAAVARRAEQRPLPKHGEIGNGRSRGANSTSTRGSCKTDYLARRIARDHPDILQRMKDGEFKSVRQAAKSKTTLHIF